MILRKPHRLKPGDVVRIVSPASVITPEKLQSTIAKLEGAGFRVEISPNVFKSHFYLAGTDAERAADLNAAFADPTVAAVLCSRGGYGCARLIPHLDLDKMAASGKMLIGFSDITTLHLALNQRGLTTLYAPMALTFSVERPDWVWESFIAAITGENSMIQEAPKGECVVPGHSEGIVTGGCLCLMTDSIGTQNSLDCAGKIVVIEDVDEAPHRVDAMLTHLILSGQLTKAAGIVVGEMTRTDEKEDASIGAWPWREVVTDRLKPLGIPTVINFPFGHCSAMLSLPLGIRARLDATSGSLSYLESLCD